MRYTATGDCCTPNCDWYGTPPLATAAHQAVSDTVHWTKNVSFDFFYNFCPKHFLYKITERDMIKNVKSSSCEVPVIRVRCQWNLDFPREIFEKYWNIKFHENPSSGSRVLPCGRTFMTKLIVSFRNFSNAPKTYTLCPEIAFMCFVWISEQTAITSLYSIDWFL
jgi:hypothetical protein